MLAHAPQAPQVWIVVLTWNNYADTTECLVSLRGLSYPHYQVLLVDNGSSDGTPLKVRQQFPEVTVIENQRNLGVPAGYNVGFRYALERNADFVLMLNNDTVLAPTLLSYLVAAAHEPCAGILVPVAYFYDRPDIVWSAGARHRQLPPAIVMEQRLLPHDHGYHQLEYAIGCCILLNRAALLQAGLLDETYYFMWEDLDLSLRIRAAGFTILQVPQAKLRHKVSRSTQPQSSLFWQMHGEGGVIFHRRHGNYRSMLAELGYFAFREFVVKQQWRFLRPFVTGLRRGLRRPLQPIAHADIPAVLLKGFAMDTETGYSSVRSDSPQEPACDFCGSSQRELLFQGPDQLLGLPGTFSFVRCRDCGLLYQSPRLPWEQLAAYYEGDYASHGPVVQDEANAVRRMVKRLGPLKQRHYVERFQKQGTLLDIGCGTGVFLAEMQVTGQWELQGLEPTPVAAEYVRRRLGIAVTEEVFEEAEFAAASQDVITMWHVLEHFGSPSQALDQAWKLLKPGGYLIFAIPSYESLGRRLFGRFWVGWDLPRHLFAFPRRVLTRQLMAHGFRIIDMSCSLISYAALGHSLTFWTQSWPPAIRPLGKLVLRAYYTPVTRLLLYPLQRIVEYLGLSSVTSWAVQKVDRDG